MYDDFDAFDTDYEYEDFRDSTGHITNFSPYEEARYQAAIDAYKQINPDVVMNICDGYKWHGMKGLYVTDRPGDLGAFWSIFDSLKA